MLQAADYEKIARIIEAYRPKIDLSIRIPKSEYERRYEQVHAKLRERDIDLVLLLVPGDAWGRSLSDRLQPQY